MDIIGNYFRPARCAAEPAGEIDAALQCTETLMASARDDLKALLEGVPELRGEIGAMLTLAHSGERLVTSIIAVTTASGTLLRRKLEPVVDPLLQQYGVLRKIAPTEGRSNRRR